MHSIRKVLGIGLALGLALGTAFAGEANAQARPRPRPHAADQVLIKFKEGVLDRDAEDLAALVGARESKRLMRRGAARRDRVGIERWWRVKLRDGVVPEEVLERLAGNPAIEWAELDYIATKSAIPNDAMFNQLWGLHNTGQTGSYSTATSYATGPGNVDADVDAPEAWDRLAGNTGTIIVAIVDSGVKYTHEDLVGRMWTNPSPTAAIGLRGRDYENNDNDPMDDDGHGTHVAGTIAGTYNNGIGVAGIAGPYDVEIMAMKFLDENGSGFTSNAALATVDAVNLGAKVINNSWGGGGYLQSLHDAIKYANDNGVLFVCASGNESTDTDETESFPSCYPLPNVLTVGAVDRQDHQAWFSNRGEATVDIGAPGVAIVSTVPNELPAYGGQHYASFNGTSMAAPHVSGAAAVVWLANQGLSMAQVKQALVQTVVPVSSLVGHVKSAGRLNLDAAVALAQSGAPITPPVVFDVASSTTGGVTYGWIDISTTGTLQTLGDEVFIPAIPIGFPFPYFGDVKTTIGLSSNGYICFPPHASPSTNDWLNTALTKTSMVAPWWDDFNIGLGGVGTVRTRTMTDAQGDLFVVSFLGVPHYDLATSNTVTFQVILRPTGEIKFQYQDAIFTGTNARNQGGSATVGISGPSTERMFSYNTKTLNASMALRFSPPGVANQPPDITSNPVTTATEDAPYSYDVNATDPDAGAVLTYSLTTFPAGMQVDSSTGVISWTPTNAQVGPNAVTARVQDQGGLSDTQSFQVVVINTNDPPSITSTAQTSATEDAPYSYDVNATDPDAQDTQTFTLDAAPNGMTIQSGTGMISWTPANAQVGGHPVTVRVTDGALAFATQSFTVNVTNVNDLPAFTSTPATTAAMQDATYTYDAEATDQDAGTTLTYSLQGALSGMSIGSSSGLFSWTPTNAQVGDRSVTVVVSDGIGSVQQQFTLAVANKNDAPSITSTALTAATEDQPYSYDVNATDPDLAYDDSLEFSLDAGYPVGMSIDTDSGIISWTPTNAQVGGAGHSVTARVTDEGDLSASQTFTVVVANVNDLPTFTSTPATSATEDVLYTSSATASDVDAGETLTLAFSLDVKPGDMAIDPTSGAITWTPTNAHVGSNDVTVRVTDSAGGSATLELAIVVTNTNDAPSIASTPTTAATAGVAYTYDVDATDPDAGQTATLAYSLTTWPLGMTIDAGSGLIQWTPNVANAGANPVTVVVTDASSATDTQTFSVTVASPPVITTAAITSAIEDATYTYNVDATDPDGGVLTFSLVAAPAGMGIDEFGVITWTPDNDDVVASNDVTVRAQDSIGLFALQSFSITVTNMNDAPSITTTTLSDATEDSPYSYTVTATDPDVGDGLAFSLTTAPATMTIGDSSGAISWTPTNDDVGTHPVTVEVTDGEAVDTKILSITVINTNDLPSFATTPAVTTVDEEASFSYDAHATDVDTGDTLTFSLQSSPSNMVIVPATGAITWVPTNAQVGDSSVTVVVSDGSGSVGQTFIVTVINTNDAPSITTTALPDATEDAAYSFTVTATDVDAGDGLTFSLTTAPATMSIGDSSGAISWTPTNDDVGTHPVTVEVTDGEAVDTKILSITVINTNDLPSFATTPAVTTVDEEASFSYDAHATDVDTGDTLTFSLQSSPSNMLIVPGTGAITWVPTNAQVGDSSVTVVVSDGSGSVGQTFIVTVINTNDAPSITTTALPDATEDAVYAFTVAATDIDAGDGLTFSLTTAPATMTIGDSSGTISWAPTNGDVGAHPVTVEVTDGEVVDTAIFSITVINTNDAPAIVTSALPGATEDALYSFAVAATDPDAGDTLTFSLDAAPANLTIGGSGLIQWTPTNAQVGEHLVTVRVRDVALAPATRSFTLAVANAPDAPSITSVAVTSASAGQAYAYDVNATDIDLPYGDSLAYSLGTAPTGMTIDGGTGLISWTPTALQSGANPVTVVVTDSTALTAQQSFTVTVASGPNIAVGSLSLVVGGGFTTVSLPTSYASMVVVCTANYSSASTPVTVRIQNAGGSTFQVRANAAGGSGGNSITVYYMVVEEGVYTQAVHGVKMEAKRFTSTVTDGKSSFNGQAVAYSQSYTSPVVLGQVMTYNDARFQTFWCRGSSSSSAPSSSTLRVGKHRGEGPSSPAYPSETLGYVVVETGTYTVNGLRFRTALGSDSIEGVGNSPPDTYTITGLTAATHAIATQAGMDGNDGSYAILYNSTPFTATQLRLAVDEDNVGDSERSHSSEQVGYMVFGPP